MFQYLVGGVCAVRKNMNAKEHTRANKWAAHVKESSMNRRDEVRILGRLGRVCRPKQ